jgi:hypothetical protein
LKDLLKEAFAPGYENRQFGDSLPTLASTQAAYEAKQQAVKEDSSDMKLKSITEASDIGTMSIPSLYFKKYMREYAQEITRAKKYFAKEDWPTANKVRKYLGSAPTPTTVDEYIKWHAGARALTGGESFGMGSGFANASSLISTIIAESGATNRQANFWDSKILPYIDSKSPKTITL